MSSVTTFDCQWQPVRHISCRWELFLSSLQPRGFTERIMFEPLCQWQSFVPPFPSCPFTETCAIWNKNRTNHWNKWKWSSPDYKRLVGFRSCFGSADGSLFTRDTFSSGFCNPWDLAESGQYLLPRLTSRHSLHSSTSTCSLSTRCIALQWCGG